MYARPVYTPHPRNFTFYRPARPNGARIGQQMSGPMTPPPSTPPPFDYPEAPPIAAGQQLPGADVQQDRVTVVWPYLILASVVGGAAFALGSGLVNRYVWGK